MILKQNEKENCKVKKYTDLGKGMELKNHAN